VVGVNGGVDGQQITMRCWGVEVLGRPLILGDGVLCTVIGQLKPRGITEHSPTRQLYWLDLSTTLRGN
jgi:hypothetical protein